MVIRKEHRIKLATTGSCNSVYSLTRKSKHQKDPPNPLQKGYFLPLNTMGRHTFYSMSYHLEIEFLESWKRQKENRHLDECTGKIKEIM